MHRSLKQPQLWELTDSEGNHTGGIFGTIRLINKEIRQSDAFPVVVFDHGLSRRRLEVDPSYKRADEREINRNEILSPEEVADDYITQYRISRNALSEIFPLFGIPVVKQIPWEGDDLMYIISKMCEKSKILTDDRDLLQLLSPNVDIRRPKADEEYTMEKFLQETGYRHMYEFVMQKAICGDGSDNIPGSCQRVAAGTAPQLIKILENTILQNKDFPKDEKELKTLCESLDVKCKKAFLNFDKDRYEKNLQLVDLSLVDNDIDDQLIDSIVATISNCKSQIDYFAANAQLSKYEINEVYPDEIIQTVNLKYDNLFV